MNDQNPTHYMHIEDPQEVFNTLSSTVAAILANVPDDGVRAILIQQTCELHHDLLSACGARPENRSITREELIEAHVKYMTKYIDTLRPAIAVFKKADSARNN